LGLFLGAFASACTVHADTLEPPGEYPEDRYAKVAVLQWAHPEYAPVPATLEQAESYKAANRETLAAWAERARAHGAELLVTPEFGVTGYPKTQDGEDQFQAPDQIAPYAESVPGPSSERLGQVAQRLGMHLAFSLAERDQVTGHYHNTLVLLGADGALLGTHRKRNLFGSERKFLRPGGGATVMNTPFGRIGMMICADIYHGPTLEDYRRAAPDLLLVSAAWTVSGAMNSFRSVARSVRATVLASNLADHPDSGVLNPDGTAQSHIREGEGLAFGYIKRRP